MPTMPPNFQLRSLLRLGNRPFVRTGRICSVFPVCTWFGRLRKWRCLDPATSPTCRALIKLRSRTHREANPPSSEGRLLRSGKSKVMLGRLRPTSLTRIHRHRRTRNPEQPTTLTITDERDDKTWFTVETRRLHQLPGQRVQWGFCANYRS